MRTIQKRLTMRQAPKKLSPVKAGLIGAGLFMLAMIAWVVINAVRNGFDLSHTPLAEHTALLTDSVKSKLPVAYVYKSKIQGAQSNYNFENGFHLTIYQVALKEAKPLGQLLKLNDQRPSRTAEVISPYAETPFLTMTKSTSEVDEVSSVNFRYVGPAITSLLQNDSLAYYHLKFKKFSISYDDDGNDVWGLSKTSAPCSISLAFIKKRKTLYIIMLYKNENQDMEFPADKLYNMLKK